MNRAPVHIGARELREQYLLPFEAAVRQERLGTMMHAYHEIDGVPCMASHELLTEILRDEWGFEGIVVSDYDGINELITSHQVTDDPAVAAAMTLRAGLDQELPRTLAYGEPLKRALERGLVDEATLDLAVGRVLRVKFELGLFEAPYADPERAIPRPGRGASPRAGVGAQVDRAARERRRCLPLAPDLRTVALLGPNADDARNLLGDYAHQLHIDTLIRRRERAVLDDPGRRLARAESGVRPDPDRARRAAGPAGRDGRPLRARLRPPRWHRCGTRRGGGRRLERPTWPCSSSVNVRA